MVLYPHVGIIAIHQPDQVKAYTVILVRIESPIYGVYTAFRTPIFCAPVLKDMVDGKILYENFVSRTFLRCVI